MRDPINFARLISYVTTLRGSALNEYDIRPLADIVDGLVGAQSSDSLNRLLSAIASGKKIDAIKEYRAMTGEPLKESKDAIEKYWPSQEQHAA